MSVLECHVWGPADGPPALLLHGVTNHGGRLRRLGEEGLAPMRVIAPDLRGHGRSTWDPPWDAGRHVDDLIETLDAHGVAAAAVAGHSFGGLLATRLARAAPDRVRRLALIDPAIGLAPERARREALGVVRDPGWASPAEARGARRALRPPHARDTVDDDLAAFLRRDEDGRYRLAHSRAAAVCAWSEMARPGVAPPRGMPTLLVTARGAAFVDDRLRRTLTDALGPDLEERGIDAGHMLFWDAYAELVAALRPFLLG